MPRLIPPESRTDAVVDAVLFLLSRDGPRGISLRAIARESRISTSSLLHHFGSREHLVRGAAGRTGRARIQTLELRSDREGVGAFLPRSTTPRTSSRPAPGWPGASCGASRTP